MKFLTILVIITLFAIFINRFFFGVENKDIVNKNTNKSIEKFEQEGNPYFADVGVALSLNVGTKKSQTTGENIKIYQNLMDLEYMLTHKEIAKNQIIFQNIELLNEYISLLETDLKELLDSSPDRLEVFEAYLSQLKFKGNQIKKHIKNLRKQQDLLKNAVNDWSLELAKLKANIKESLKNLNKYGATNGIDKYLDLKAKYNFGKTYLYLVTKFIENFENLQLYNYNFIKELEANKAIIVSGEPIIVPKGKTEILKKYGLLIEEIK